MNANNRTVLIIGGSNEMFAYRTATCLHEAGYRVVAAMPNRRSALRRSRLISKVVHLDLSRCVGEAEAAVAIQRIVAGNQVAVVFPVDLPSIEACNAVAEHLLVPVVALPEPEVVASCNDKSRFASVLAAAGINQPADPVVVNSIAEVDEVAPDLFDTARFVKQVAGDGAIGVARIDSVSELRSHIASGLPGTSPPLLVQEYIPGHDIDCSFYAESGRMIASAVQTRVAQHDPTVTFARNAAVTETCAEIVASLGYDGLGHADLRIDERDGRVLAIELNPRVWASVHYAHVAGANFPALAVRRAFGEPVDDLEVELGPVRNPDVDVMACVKALVGGSVTAPGSLNAAERRMYSAKHGDPLVLLTLQVRSKLWRLKQRLLRTKTRSGGASLTVPADA